MFRGLWRLSRFVSFHTHTSCIQFKNVRTCFRAVASPSSTHLSFSTDSSGSMDSSGTQFQENHVNQGRPDFYQNVVVMRHGDRLDNFEPLWKTTAARPWDPPLMEGGRVRAFRTGQKLRSGLGFPIHRVFVSPFIRCIQTACEVISALSAVHDDPNANAGDTVPFDPSKLKVSVEYGLCEIMNRGAIHLDVAPKDGNWGFDISELEAMLPSGTVDDKVERVYKELPKWEETLPCTRSRYAQIFKVLADKYPTDNLLLLAHGEAVNVAVSEFKKDVNIYQVSYCAYAELKRPIFKKNQSFAAGDFTVLTNSGQTGVTYFPTSALTDNVSHSSI